MDIDVRAVSPALGAEVVGVDLSQLNDKTFGLVHDALMAHQVLFFYDQDFSTDQHISLAQRFGEVETAHPMFPHVAGEPRVSLLRNDKENPPFNDNWHTDVTFRESPPMGVVLRCVQTPDVGGDTIWSSMTAAYGSLSKQTQDLLLGLNAVHDFATGFRKSKLRRDDFEERLQKAAIENPPVTHPVVRRHPVTGRLGLFVNSGFTSHVEGLPREESDSLLAMLYTHVQRPEFQVRFRWQKNAVAIWDNRCTQHYALGDYYPATRIMHRVTILGDRPVY
jgi:taurine dioxygenase